jgi:5-formyltetrahydrofolate cyclo-ligase
VIPTTAHDVYVDLIVTPDRVIRTPGRRGPASELLWDELTDEKIEAIPLLRRLRQEKRE